VNPFRLAAIGGEAPPPLARFADKRGRQVGGIPYSWRPLFLVLGSPFLLCIKGELAGPLWPRLRGSPYFYPLPPRLAASAPPPFARFAGKRGEASWGDTLFLAPTFPCSWHPLFLVLGSPFLLCIKGELAGPLWPRLRGFTLFYPLPPRLAASAPPPFARFAGKRGEASWGIPYSWRPLFLVLGTHFSLFLAPPFCSA